MLLDEFVDDLRLIADGIDFVIRLFADSDVKRKVPVVGGATAVGARATVVVTDPLHLLRFLQVPLRQ